MTLRRDATTGNYSADIRDHSVGRLHISLKTTRKADAVNRYAALTAFVREGDRDLIALLRNRRATIEAIARLYRERKPFAELHAARSWPTLAVAADRYVSWLKSSGRADNSITNAYYALVDAIDFFGGEELVSAITEEKVAAYRAAVDARDLAANTVRAKFVHLSAMYRWLQSAESKAAMRAHRVADVLYNPIDRQLLPGEGQPRKRFLSQAEVHALMAATPAYYALFVALGILAGLRYDEARTLERSDLDLEHGFVSVRGKLIAPDEEWTPKSKASERGVPLYAALVPIAERHLREFAGERWLYTSKFTGGPMDYELGHRVFKRIVGDAELVTGKTDPQGVTYHTLRHTFASHLVMAGVDLFTVARLMGHANTREVERVYGHLSPQHRQRAIDLLGDALSKAFGPQLISEAEA